MMSGTAEIQLDGGGIVRAIYGPEARWNYYMFMLS
jgi:hypothetical protein